MLKTFLVFFLILTFASCQNKVVQDSTFTLKGDWLLDSIDGKKLSRPLSFSFEDSTCSYVSPFNTYDSPYTFKNDTLIIREREYKRGEITQGGKIDFQFRFAVSKGHLNLIPLTKETKELLSNYYTGENGEVTLQRLSKVNDYEFSRIGFYTGPCYGYCPIMYLEIDRNGEFIFYGVDFTEIKGPFSGKLSSYELQNIRRRLNAIDFKKLKEDYSATYTDAETTGVMIETESGVFRTEVYGHNEEPIELILLFNILEKQYQRNNMVIDSGIVEKIKFKEFSEDVLFLLKNNPIEK